MYVVVKEKLNELKKKRNELNDMFDDKGCSKRYFCNVVKYAVEEVKLWYL